MATADKLPDTLKRLRLFGLLARIDEVRDKPWLEEVLAIELEEKTRRSLAHRQHLAGIGPFKPVSSFDWKWPRKVDRPLIEELFTLGFIAEGANVVLLGPNGVGKTMLLRNIADRALNAGHHVVVRTASDLLADLIKQLDIEQGRRFSHRTWSRLNPRESRQKHRPFCLTKTFANFLTRQALPCKRDLSIKRLASSSEVFHARKII